MSFAAELWERNRATAERCLAHPFLRGLADGSLDGERYRHFMAQDAFFLEAFARGYAHCLARSPEREGLYRFHDLLDGVFDELRLHRKAAAELGIDLDHVVPSEATLEYTGFLQASIETETGTGETLAAMTPCMCLFAFLGRELAPSASPHGAYREWIETYAGEEFQALARSMESLLDHYARRSEGEAANYRRAMELEQRFFDSAWQLGG